MPPNPKVSNPVVVPLAVIAIVGAVILFLLQTTGDRGAETSDIQRPLAGTSSPLFPIADADPYAVMAACLAKQGAVFYGAFWCSHCIEQKRAFKDGADLLPYVECSTPDGAGQNMACDEKEIQAYPTWVFSDGRRVEGGLSLERLAEETGCQLPPSGDR